MPYTKEDVERALEEIRIIGAALRATAKKFGIPHSTLAEKSKGS